MRQGGNSNANTRHRGNKAQRHKVIQIQGNEAIGKEEYKYKRNTVASY